MIAIPWDLGTRTTAEVPLSNLEGGVSVMAGGTVVALTLRSPDDPAASRARAQLSAVSQVRASEIAAGGVTFERLAVLDLAYEDALTGYAVALVSSWTIPEVPCSPEMVAKLFTRTPEALVRVMEVAGDADRFLHPSLRVSAVASKPRSKAAR